VRRCSFRRGRVDRQRCLLMVVDAVRSLAPLLRCKPLLSLRRALEEGNKARSMMAAAREALINMAHCGREL
jgi:hypothetical protein